jgi:hypothetical protein
MKIVACGLLVVAGGVAGLALSHRDSRMRNNRDWDGDH